MTNNTLVKIYFHDSPVCSFLREFVEALIVQIAIGVETLEEADLIICNNDSNRLNIGKYAKTGKPVILVYDPRLNLKELSIPENVVPVDGFMQNSLMTTIKAVVESTKEKLGAQPTSNSEEVSLLPDAKNILVIDDDPRNIKSAKELLAGHHLTTATTYDSASKALAYGTFDVVLSDLQLPKNLEDLKISNFGFALMFEAAKKGVGRIAIYTRADHHGDPVAMAIIGQHPDGEPIAIGNSVAKILSSRDHYGTKDWAHALEEVMK